MESKPEKTGLHRTVTEHRSWGGLESVEEIVTDESGREVERTDRSPDGELRSHVRFIRDGNGRLLEEEWEEQEEGRVKRGKYVYSYDADGRQADKVWIPAEQTPP